MNKLSVAVSESDVNGWGGTCPRCGQVIDALGGCGCRRMLADEQEATIQDGRLVVNDVHGSPRLVFALELADAIEMAKMVLAYAANHGEDAVSDLDEIGADESAWFDLRADLLADYQAMRDSVVERW